MKRLLLLVCCVVILTMAIVLVGCTDNTNSPSPTSSVSPDVTDTQPEITQSTETAPTDATTDVPTDDGNVDNTDNSGNIGGTDSPTQ